MLEDDLLNMQYYSCNTSYINDNEKAKKQKGKLKESY